VRAGYFVATLRDELVQALDGFGFLVVRAEVENLSYRAIFPGLNLYFSARLFLRQGSRVIGYRDAGNYEPFSFGIEMGIGKTRLPLPLLHLLNFLLDSLII